MAAEEPCWNQQCREKGKYSVLSCLERRRDCLWLTAVRAPEQGGKVLDLPLLSCAGEKRRMPEGNTAHHLHAWKCCPFVPTVSAEAGNCAAGASNEALADIFVKTSPLQLLKGPLYTSTNFHLLPFATSNSFWTLTDKQGLTYTCGEAVEFYKQKKLSV